ncbi:multidrug ABC transporter ATP-binding protein [Lacticaseibacillus chiayiensis]|uniref:ABC transporter ATP-binding protein n=1 Tax=Lacticaseibacillus chiayiensis TaxID=2100821 RepID=A0A4Q1UES7_9LACO|nr:ABC transporter ATP-binding protein [Lacticaseibacillus chiayiensis]QVI33694.1 ABC transporter ATP-binding protein [Lacticaseibacillus chiayiensis]RXT29627.1 multidrug ABC transporter ATP-binding protein [Lacticaseibacillus chiayiensis]RXT59337.1 multidrug ABC transporter ATP-binding protein [Lacticaseibacillus chiayiensis]UYN55439.1 ABC transporter ATP-binding protein [Lacticaseibacillus chiayiensis]
MTLTIDGLTGGYGNLTILKDVSFTVPSGKIVGLIGLNGAGKSTTIKHIIGLLTPQTGTIDLDGKTLKTDPTGFRAGLAYVPETPVLYPELTLREHLDMTIMAYDLDKDAAWREADAMLKRFRLDNKLDWFPAKFSKGMQQKVMIVAAFMTHAQLFIIDEPFTGLDPLAIHDLLDIVTAKKQQGASVLMSTHILATAQQYADEFVLIKSGKVRATGDMASLKQQFGLQDGSLDDIYMKMTEEKA